MLSQRGELTAEMTRDPLDAAAVRLEEVGDGEDAHGEFPSGAARRHAGSQRITISIRFGNSIANAPVR